jgi:hypothetical protein
VGPLVTIRNTGLLRMIAKNMPTKKKKANFSCIWGMGTEERINRISIKQVWDCEGHTYVVAQSPPVTLLMDDNVSLEAFQKCF